MSPIDQPDRSPSRWPCIWLLNGAALLPFPNLQTARSPTTSPATTTLVTSVPTQGRDMVYVVIGDVFAYACAAGLVIMAGWAVRASRQSKSKRSSISSRV